MPNVTEQDLANLGVMFTEMVACSVKIKEKAPACKQECEEIERLGQHVFTLINEIRARGSD
jgi:hypothetical protein